MKILLFNLGPIQHRILAWGVDGFKSFFEQDTILWGPIPDSHFSYGDKEIPIIPIFEETTIGDIFGKLPENWVPDIVICDTSVLSYVPDIYLCPVKTILFTRDSWSDTIFNRNLVELFDFIKYSVIDREAYSKLRINVLPLSGFAVAVPPEDSVSSPFEKRPIDVIAIANYNDAFYHERYKTLYKLANNKGDFNVKFFRGIKRSEIYSYYQQSKIVIDWAHTLSNRSFEAALNKCLLFSYEDNKLVEDFWIPWEEYVPYKEENLVELLEYYTRNPNLSRKIIERAHAKILSNPANWGQMAWNNIQMALNSEIKVQDRIDFVQSIPKTDIIHRSATALLYNYEYNTEFPVKWKDVYFERIDRALSASTENNFKIKPLIEASRMAVLLKRHSNADRYLSELMNVLPDYAWTYFLQAKVSFERRKDEEALVEVQKAIEYGIKSPGLLQKYLLPVIEKGNACDGRRITNYMWQPVHKHENEFQVNSLLHLSYELMGQIYQELNQTGKAIQAYSEALKYNQIPSCLYRLNPLLDETHNYRLIAELTGKAIETSPYDSILNLYKAYAHLQLKEKAKAIRILADHRNALKSFLGVRKTTYIRNAIIILIISAILQRHTGSKLISKFINTLKRKSTSIPEAL